MEIFINPGISIGMDVHPGGQLPRTGVTRHGRYGIKRRNANRSKLHELHPRSGQFEQIAVFQHHRLSADRRTIE